MDKYKFGEFIYQRRKAQGLTQDELGRSLGVTNKAVSKWETGETLPEIPMLELLSKALNVTIDELLTQKVNKEINEKKIKINRLFIILIIILFLLEITTILLFTIKKEERIIINQENIEEYLNINPLISFDDEDQRLVIQSSYIVKNDYSVYSEIDFIIRYRVNCSYYYLNNKNEKELGTITYYKRLIEVNLINNDLVIESLSLEPIDKVDSYLGLKNINVTYEIVSGSGTLLRR